MLFRLMSAVLLMTCASGAMALNGDHFDCQRSCKTTALECARKNPQANSCKVDESKCLAGCPANPLVREKPVPKNPTMVSKVNLCKQRCATSRDVCLGGGGSETPGSAGGNSETVCGPGHDACVARCETDPNPVRR